MLCLLLCHSWGSPAWSSEAAGSQPNAPHQCDLCIPAVQRRRPQETNAQLCSLHQFSSPSVYPIPVFSIHPPHTGTSTPGLTWGCANLPTSTQPILPSQSIHPSWDQGPWLGHQLSFPASADKPLQKETEEEESLSLSPPSPYRPSLTQPGTTSERIPSKEWHR